MLPKMSFINISYCYWLHIPHNSVKKILSDCSLNFWLFQPQLGLRPQYTALQGRRYYQYGLDWHQILFSVQAQIGGQILFSVQVKMNTYGRFCHHFRHCLLANLISSPSRFQTTLIMPIRHLTALLRPTFNTAISESSSCPLHLR